MNSIVLYIIQSYLVICSAIAVITITYKLCSWFEVEEDEEYYR